ncbi:hypothetical protein OE88DRAFT_1645166 [Heliocybe sulcata]|uniref:Uncharacterized protein n=1 Tax=Heliocybe sulcata TaxID=5364 RepID=A0A5C3N156_9AGAM|nr:hypothetical protein OE88DRAFT_1645166 [Heliocybe sulcata]
MPGIRCFLRRVKIGAAHILLSILLPVIRFLERQARTNRTNGQQDVEHEGQSRDRDDDEISAPEQAPRYSEDALEVAKGRLEDLERGLEDEARRRRELEQRLHTVQQQKEEATAEQQKKEEELKALTRYIEDVDRQLEDEMRTRRTLEQESHTSQQERKQTQGVLDAVKREVEERARQLHAEVQRRRAVEQELHAAQEMDQQTQEDLQAMRRDVEDRDRQLDDESRKRTSLEQELLASQLKREQTEEVLEAANRSVEDRDRRLDEEVRKRRALEQELHTLRQEKRTGAEEAPAPYAALARAYEDQGRLLQDRTKQLRFAEKFLKPVEPMFAMEIKNMFDDLNADTLHLGATVMDAVDLRNRSEPAQIAQYQDDVRLSLGQTLAEALATTEDTSVLLAAIECTVCLWSERIISSWTLGFANGMPRANEESEQEDIAYKNLYESILANQPHSVAGRWRSLAREHMRRQCRDGDTQYQDLLAKARQAIQQVCRVTGCVGDELWSRILGTIERRLARIIQLSFRIRNVIGESITSCDYTVLLVRPGEPFDPQRMEEDGGDDLSDSNGVHVLCTTQLGLMRREKGGMEAGAPFEQGIVLLPKVALVSLLRASEAPPGPRQRRPTRRDTRQMRRRGTR